MLTFVRTVCILRLLSYASVMFGGWGCK